MKETAVNAFGVSLTLGLSLYLWRVLYPATDWGVLTLVPLALLLFTGSFWASDAVFRASIKVAVRVESPLAWIVTGRVRALLGSTLFTLIAVPLLAWYAIASTYHEMLLLAFLCCVAPLLFAGVEHKLDDHLTPPFTRATAFSAATIIAVVFFAPVLAWANWNFTPQPVAIQTASLEEALQLGFSQLPERRGWIAEILAPFYALEYAKLWFVVQVESPKWLSFWYSIDTALISIVAARASVVLMSVVQLTAKVKDESKHTSRRAQR